MSEKRVARLHGALIHRSSFEIELDGKRVDKLCSNLLNTSNKQGVFCDTCANDVDYEASSANSEASSSVDSIFIASLQADMEDFQCTPFDGRSDGLTTNHAGHGPTDPVVQESVDEEHNPLSVWRRLVACMIHSRVTHEALEEYDRQQGLRRSQCVTMTRTSRSRRQLLLGRLLTKWNGQPLVVVGGDGSQR